MNKNKIVSDLKTAGVVAATTLTLNVYGAKQLSENQMQIIQHKTDSAAKVDNEYISVLNEVDLYNTKIKEYHDVNKRIAQMYVEQYIKQNIEDLSWRRYMLDAVKNNTLINDIDFDEDKIDNLPDDVDMCSLDTMYQICYEYRWFNDFILYMTDRYTDKQLLKSGFFKVMNDDFFKQVFEYNIKRMDALEAKKIEAEQKSNAIHKEIWNKYASEVKKTRKR